jgi:hypothetical protein
MWEEMRRFVQARLDALSTANDHIGPEHRSPVQGVAEQISALAAGFLQWSAEARQSMVTEIRSIVTSQMDDLGLATKGDVAELRTRVERLESAPVASDRSRTTARKPGAPSRKRTTAARKPIAPARKPSARPARPGSSAAKGTKAPASRRARPSGTGTA